MAKVCCTWAKAASSAFTMQVCSQHVAVDTSVSVLDCYASAIPSGSQTRINTNLASASFLRNELHLSCSLLAGLLGAAVVWCSSNFHIGRREGAEGLSWCWVADFKSPIDLAGVLQWKLACMNAISFVFASVLEQAGIEQKFVLLKLTGLFQWVSLPLGFASKRERMCEEPQICTNCLFGLPCREK
eukprot:3601792-Amphidinium_carterae.1